MIEYPIKFEPILQQKLWGGSKLKEIFHKKTDKVNIGESWEISGVEGFVSHVKNGSEKGKSLKELIDEYKEELVGKKIYEQFGNDFPLLIKFIDANKDLSVQLHPNDKLAKERHNSFGKTEMWYIMQADKGSRLNIGFNRTVSKQEYLEHLENGKILDILNFEEVEKGDAFFINTGKVHAICSGIMLAEIQQTSDITYRIYDWDRVDDEGNSRELHTSQALEAIDFEKRDDHQRHYEKKLNTSSPIATCDYFTTNYLPVKGNFERKFSEKDYFVIYMAVEGVATFSVNGNKETIEKGETLLIPAKITNFNISADNAELLEIYID